MGQRHRRHLKETRRVLCASLLTGGKPNGYCAGVDRRAREMFEQLAEQTAKREGVTKPLSVTRSMEACGK